MEISPNLKGTEKVLLAEDEPAVRRSAERVLTRADYTVVAAKDGRAALEKWEAREGDFEVLVSDVLMPKMSGIELARKLTACKPDLRVLLISGYSGDEFDLKELDEVGAAFINKPVTQEILLSRVRELADKIPVGS